MTQCVFLDSSNQLMSNVSFIKPEFPPSVDLWELITKHVADSCKNSRSPNAFMIYRKVFVETARRDGYQLPMRVVSSLASKAWTMEPDIVKLEYKRLSREANDLRDKMLPKAIRKRKKQKWNIISFPPSDNSDACKSTKNSVVVKKKIKKSSNKKRLNVKPNDKVELPSSSPPPKEIPRDVSSPIVDLNSDSALDHIPVPSFPDSQSQQQEGNLQEYYLDLEHHPGFYEPSEIDFTIGGAFNEEFEYDSPGFLTFYDGSGNCYPSFWFEY